MTLGTVPVEKQTLFGSILFNRGITGARYGNYFIISFLLIHFRVIPANAKTVTLEGCEFQNFGSHTDEKHGGYLNMACGVGQLLFFTSQPKVNELVLASCLFPEFAKRIKRPLLLFCIKICTGSPEITPIFFRNDRSGDRRIIQSTTSGLFKLHERIAQGRSMFLQQFARR